MKLRFEGIGLQEVLNSNTGAHLLKDGTPLDTQWADDSLEICIPETLRDPIDTVVVLDDGM